MAGKYTPLENYLRDLPESQREVELRFEQIEKIIKSKLPPSAFEDRRWWEHETEGNHINLRAWSNASWKVEHVDVYKKRVKLARVG
jgi:putative restriction endonuclease